MAEPFLGEVRMTSFGYAPNGWALCNGQFMPINQNQALFALLGTMYGGNGQTTFALPDLRGKAPMHFGAGFNLGQTGGQEAVTLTISQMPTHFHTLTASNLDTGLATGPNGNIPALSTQNPYEATFNAAMTPGSVTNVGGSQPHLNWQPYRVISFMIALIGIFPAQS